MHIINNIGKTITVNDIDILLSDFLTYNIITQQEAKLLKVATSDNVLRLNSEIKDEVRARIFKNMFRCIFTIRHSSSWGGNTRDKSV